MAVKYPFFDSLIFGVGSKFSKCGSSTIKTPKTSDSQGHHHVIYFESVVTSGRR